MARLAAASPAVGAKIVLAERTRTYYDATAVAQPRTPGLEGLVEAETCVIGGGLAGLATALDLAERGPRCRPARGASRSAGVPRDGTAASWRPASRSATCISLDPVGAAQAPGFCSTSAAWAKRSLASGSCATTSPASRKSRRPALRHARTGPLLERQRPCMARAFRRRPRISGRGPGRRACLATERYGGGLFNPRHVRGASAQPRTSASRRPRQASGRADLRAFALHAASISTGPSKRIVTTARARCGPARS